MESERTLLAVSYRQMHSEAARLIERHRSRIEALCAKYAVRRLRIFGSALTDQWQRGQDSFAKRN